MFITNTSHKQPSMFSKESGLSEKNKKRLNSSWAKSYYELIFSEIDEKIFAPIYCKDNGRSNFPINILVSLEIIKEMHNITDEILYENYFFHTLYHHALGIEEIDDFDFSIRTLYNFRYALAEYDSKHNTNLMMKVFENGRDKIIKDLGIKTGLQRSDSVMIGANIKKMNRLMLFHKVLSNFVRRLNKLGYNIDNEILDLVKEDENSISYRLASEEVFDTTILVGRKILGLTEEYKSDSKLTDTKEYKNAIRLLSDQCNIIEDKFQKRINLKEPKDISSGSLQNPADSDATYRTKRNEKHRGYVNFTAETCDPENVVQVVTSVDTYKNNIDDSKIAVEKFPEIKKQVGLDTMIVDGAFPSPTLVELAKGAFDIVATAIRGAKKKVKKLIGINLFKFDNLGLITACPNGERPVKQKLDKNKVLTASFDRRKCNACPMKVNCVAFISEKKCQLKVDSTRLWLNKREQNLEDKEFLVLCRMRPAVEGLMDNMKPDTRDGRTRFRGLTRVQNRMILKAIGINFKRRVAHTADETMNFSYLLKNIWNFISRKYISLQFIQTGF